MVGAPSMIADGLPNGSDEGNEVAHGSNCPYDGMGLRIMHIKHRIRCQNKAEIV